MILFLRALFSYIPGGRRLADRWARTDGKDASDYLYHEHVVWWLHKPAIKQNLPPLLRFYASYCGLACYQTRILGGKAVFRWLGWLSDRLGLDPAMRLDLGSHILFANIKDPRMLKVPRELLEGEIVAELGAHLKEGDTFLDVGSNHGSFSIVASQIVGKRGRVIAVEPQPNLADMVRRSLAANDRAPFEVHAMACGDREGEIEFVVSRESSGSSGVFPAYSAGKSHHRITVPLKRFDEAIDWRTTPGRIFLKLDVEGSEMAFLGGASEMIRTRNPLILMEVNLDSMRAAGVTGPQMVEKLESLGYSHFIEAGSAMQPLPISDLFRGSQHNVILFPGAASIQNTRPAV